MYSTYENLKNNKRLFRFSSKKSVQNSKLILNEIYKLKPNETDVKKINKILESDTRGRFNVFGSDKIGNKFTNYSDFEKKKINQEKNEQYKKTNEYKRKEDIIKLVDGLKDIRDKNVGEYLETFQKLTFHDPVETFQKTVPTFIPLSESIKKCFKCSFR